MIPGLGEIAAPVVLALLEKTGVFEVKPPFVLQRTKEFPKCGDLLDVSKPVGPLAGDVPSKYVSLCRFTALAWAVWISAAALFLCVVISIAYHAYRWEDPLGQMSHHYPLIVQFASSSSQVSCSQILYMVMGIALVMIVYYTSLLSDCRDKEAKLKKALRRTRRVATAS